MGWCTLIDLHHDQIGAIERDPGGFARTLTLALASGDRSESTAAALRHYGVTLVETRDSYAAPGAATSAQGELVVLGAAAPAGPWGYGLYFGPGAYVYRQIEGRQILVATAHGRDAEATAKFLTACRASVPGGREPGRR